MLLSFKIFENQDIDVTILKHIDIYLLTFVNFITT